MASHDFFMSHTWRYDALGRSNHARVGHAVHALRALGSAVWYDEESLRIGNIQAAMTEGIEHSSVFVVCVTLAYLQKVHNALGSLSHCDSCAHEWTCAFVRRKPMIALIMEPDMLDVSQWPYGPVTAHLASNLYIDGSGDTWADAAKQLVAMRDLVSPRVGVGVGVGTRAPSRPPPGLKVRPDPSLRARLLKASDAECETPRAVCSLIGCVATTRRAARKR